MARRAIYLDEAERELCRCLCDYALNTLVDSRLDDAAARLARQWTRSSVKKLRPKFEEPPE